MTATVTEDVQEQVLGIVRKSQEMTLDAIKQVVETVNAAAEKLPAVPFADKLPSAAPRCRARPPCRRRRRSCPPRSTSSTGCSPSSASSPASWSRPPPPCARPPSRESAAEPPRHADRRGSAETARPAEAAYGEHRRAERAARHRAAARPGSAAH